MPDVNPWTQPWEPHNEIFEVVMVKKDVPPHRAEWPGDFTRVRVEAESTLAAMGHADVLKKAEEGWRYLATAKPGQDTQDEILARQRKLDIANRPIDRANV